MAKERPTPNARQAETLQRLSTEASTCVIGIDEVGLGAGAGPLVVVGVCAHKLWDHELARDSKKLTPRQRERGAASFLAQPAQPTLHSEVALHRILLASYEAHEVDQLGVQRAVQKLTAYIAQTLFSLCNAPIVLDGKDQPYIAGIPWQATYQLTSADALVPSVSVASVVAKVFRDHEMETYDEVFPGYGFKNHKGYLGDETHEHNIALRTKGACVVHRLSYNKIAEAVLNSSLWLPRQRKHEMRVWTTWLLP